MVTEHAEEFTETELTNLSMTITVVNTSCEITSVIEEMNGTEPSKLVSVHESSKRLERNLESLENLDDSTTLPTARQESNFTTIPWNIAPSLNVSETTAFIDYDITEDVIAVLAQKSTLEEPSSTLSATVQLLTDTQGEAKCSSAIYGKTGGVWIVVKVTG
ncbi:hypothetical protein LOAG_08218 [Loa loa]|uniref:H_lectin domain-containing protein n=1 Tax=Loa loa TaxID=7209 RepID=A0A1I7VSB3_LOALO|nr:hypothetical protein LOAG_08218 [Loa loa]EFO20274.2 hypothetical protein LOAG_08218 [Loa loa]